RGDRVDDPVDDLLQRRLALGRAEGAAEVLLAEDVRGVDRPRGRHLDVALLERDGAVSIVGDAGVSALPVDLVIGIDPGSGEVPADPDPRLLRRQRHRLSLCSKTYCVRG